jgi:hypothetical protein
MHVVFECTYYKGIREQRRFLSLFHDSTQDMLAFTTQEQQYKVCLFVHTVLQARSEKLKMNPRLDDFESSKSEELDDL